MEFTIGELAKEFSVSLRTLRFYEDKKLVNPKRDGITRIYSKRDRARIKLVLMGKRVGFSLKEIKEMLDLYDLKDGQSTQLHVSLKRFNEQINLLQKQKHDVEQAIDELTKTLNIVETMLSERKSQAEVMQ